MAKKVDLGAALKKAGKSWNKTTRAKALEGGMQEFDDGRYMMRLVGLSVGLSESGGRLQATFRWKFLDGDYEGKTYRSYQGLENEVGQEIFGKDLIRLGYDVSEFEFTEEEFETLNKEIKKDKPVCRVALKTNGDFQNLRINRLMDPDDLEDEDDESEDDEDEKPKKKSSKKSSSKKSKDEDEDEEDEDSDDEEEDDDSDEDEEDSDDEEEDEKPKKGKKTKASKSKGKKSKDEDEDDEDSDDEDEDDEESEDEDDEESETVAVVVGSTVKVKTKDGVKKGEVTEIDEDEGKLKVKIDKKTVTLAADKILSVEEPPAKTKGKKTKK